MLACGVLAAAIVMQLLIPASPPPLDAGGLAPRRPRLVTVPPVVPEYSAILTAPIFAPDRRPGDSSDIAVPGGGLMDGYAALGVVIGHGIAAGVVSSPDGKTQTLRRGGEVDDWRLIDVSRTRLSFARKDARHDLIVGAPAHTATDAAGSSDTTETDQ